MKLISITVLAMAGILTTQVYAAGQLTPEQKEQARAKLEQRFTQADSNRDGQVTRAEAKGVMPRLYRHFEQVDTNGNGAVTLDEIYQTLSKALQQRAS